MRRCLLTGVLFACAMPALAQRPIQTFDPFYQGETAIRHFYDAYAVAAELSYRPPGLLQSESVAGAVAGPALGVNLRMDYRLGQYVDLGLYVDAAGNGAGRSLDLSWIALKVYRTSGGSDYALRFAIDPSSDGRGGFPQTDLGFLYSTLLSPTVSQDFGIGLRRVGIGFQELADVTPVAVEPGDPIVSPPGVTSEVVRGRTQGWEMHFSWSHNIVFDPAGSHLFAALQASGGRYDLVEWTANSTDQGAQNPRSATRFTGGLVAVRSGILIERPGYQFAPFLSLPVRQWARPLDDWPRARAQVGVRFMVR